MSYEKATTPALLYHSPGAKSIDLCGNPVYSVSCEGACGVVWSWPISSFSIRFEDTAIEDTVLAMRNACGLIQLLVKSGLPSQVDRKGYLRTYLGNAASLLLP